MTASPFYGHFDDLRGRSVCGWVWSPAEPGRQITVTVLIDDEPVASGLAAAHRPDLEAAGIGDGCKSFGVVLPPETMDGAEHEITVTAEDGSLLLGSPRRMVLPDFIYRPLPPDPSPYPIELAVCAIAKNEARYMLEWIAYHRLVGVQHFLIFDNDSDDGMSDMLERLAQSGFVERVPWPRAPGPAPQLSAYAEGVKRLRGQAKWIAFIDLDEFLNPLENGSVPSVLADYEGAGGLVVPWRIFGSSGEVAWRDDLVIRRFTHRAEAENPLNAQVKTIARADCVGDVGVHTPLLARGQLVDEFLSVAGAISNPDHHPVPDAKRLVLNHYFGKSWEEWQIKRAKGRADLDASRTDHEFAGHDRNDVEDAGMLARCDQVEEEMNRLREQAGIAAL